MMKAFALWLRGVWEQIVIYVRMVLGDTRPKEVREAPIGYMGQNKAPNLHNRMTMTNEYYRRPQERVFTPELAAKPLRDARKPVFDGNDERVKVFFADLVALGLFDRRCNLNGFTKLWGFQVLYDKQELRMFQYPVVNGSPTVILTAEGISRKADTDLHAEAIYELLHELRKHVAGQNLSTSKPRWVEEYEKLVEAGLYHPDLDLATVPGEWVFLVPKGSRELRIYYRSGVEPICVIHESTGQPVVTYNPSLEEWQKEPGVVVPLLFIYPYIAIKNLNNKEKP